MMLAKRMRFGKWEGNLNLFGSPSIPAVSCRRGFKHILHLGLSRLQNCLRLLWMSGSLVEACSISVVILQVWFVWTSKTCNQGRRSKLSTPNADKMTVMCMISRAIIRYSINWSAMCIGRSERISFPSRPTAPSATSDSVGLATRRFLSARPRIFVMCASSSISGCSKFNMQWHCASANVQCP